MVFSDPTITNQIVPSVAQDMEQVADVTKAVNALLAWDGDFGEGEWAVDVQVPGVAAYFRIATVSARTLVPIPLPASSVRIACLTAPQVNHLPTCLLVRR